MPKPTVINAAKVAPIYEDATCRRMHVVSAKEHGAKDIDAWYAEYKKGRSKKGVVYKHDEICYIVKGAGMLTMEDGTRVPFKQGDLVYRPAGAKCDVEMTEDAISICMFSPAVVDQGTVATLTKKAD